MRLTKKGEMAVSGVMKSTPPNPPPDPEELAYMLMLEIAAPNYRKLEAFARRRKMSVDDPILEAIHNYQCVQEKDEEDQGDWWKEA